MSQQKCGKTCRREKTEYIRRNGSHQVNLVGTGTQRGGGWG